MFRSWGSVVRSDDGAVLSARKVEAGHQLLSLIRHDAQLTDRLVGEKMFKAVFVTRDQKENSAAS